MRHLKLVLVLSFSVLSGCSAVDCMPEKDTAYVLGGTNTAVVGVSVDKDGIPEGAYKKIIVNPGQKILFAGPDKFLIFFKDKKTPNRQIENVSSKGVIVIGIPDGLLEQREFIEEFRKTGQVAFSYGIRVGNKELDPIIIVRKQN